MPSPQAKLATQQLNLLKVAKLLINIPERFSTTRVIGSHCGIAGYAAMLSMMDIDAMDKRKLTEAETFMKAAEYTGLSEDHPLLQHANSDWSIPKEVTALTAAKAIHDLVHTGSYRFDDAPT